MRIIFFILAVIPNVAFSIGAEILDKKLLNQYGFAIKSHFDKSNSCHEFEIVIPELIKFSDLGEKPYHFASGKYIEADTVSDNPYKLMKQGSRVSIAIEKRNERLFVSHLCIAERDINNSFININYHRESSILMLLYIPLHKHTTRRSNAGKPARGT